MVAGILVGVFNVVLGGEAAFVQVFAVVVGSGVVLALRGLFSAPLDYARETLSSPTSLNAVLPFFEDNTFGARLLGSIDLFVVWWMVSLAIGMGVLYKRRTTPIATTLLAVYVAIATVHRARQGDAVRSLDDEAEESVHRVGSRPRSAPPSSPRTSITGVTRA